MTKLGPVKDRVIEQAFSSGFASMTEQDRVFFLLWSYMAMVENGGFPAFFYNSTGEYYEETTGALRTVGLAEHALLLERAAVLNGLEEEAETDLAFDALYQQFVDAGGSDRVLGVLQAWYFRR